MRRVFISDVHLTPREPSRTARLAGFLAREAPRTDELYVLGDLFDYWIGPKHLDLPDYREALDAIRRAAAGGLRILFILGNRDFYVRRRFARETGIEVAPARTGHRMAIASKNVYLCHGDYLEGRRDLGFWVQELIRSRAIESIYTRLPAAVGKAGAEFYRRLSDNKVRRAGHLAEEALAAEFRSGTDIIVCGHVHRAEEIRRQVEGRERILFTLGDWADGESYLEEEDGRWRLCGQVGRGAKKCSGRTGGHSATV